jgi:hypothetical protein
LVAALFASAGVQARTEVTVPQWSRRREDGSVETAVLDVVTEASPLLGCWYVDVTIRHSQARQYQPMAGSTDGYALEAARRAKEARYPPAGRMRPTVLAAEVHGRVNTQLEGLIRRVVAVSHAYRAAAGSGGAAPAVAGWRARFAVALQVGVYEAFASWAVGQGPEGTPA